MEGARYHREHAEHFFQMARHMSDPLAANLMRAAAASHFAQAIELEDNAKATKEAEKRSDLSDSFRTIRTAIGQELRSQPVPRDPPPQRLLDALQVLHGPSGDDAGEEEAASSAPPSERDSAR